MTPSAISWPVPARAAGLLSINAFTPGSFSSPNGITPGAMELTLTVGAQATASARVRWATPALEAQ